MSWVSIFRRWLLYPFGRHERSRGQAKLDGPDILSKCKHCGVRMRKDMERGWIVDSAAS